MSEASAGVDRKPDRHIGRSWGGPAQLESGCPCGKAPCGLVDTNQIHPDCKEHTLLSGKTMRSIHKAEDCPGSSGG